MLHKSLLLNRLSQGKKQINNKQNCKTKEPNVCTYLPSRFMFCVIAPLLFIMESIILTGSSRIRPEDLFSSRVLLVVPQLSKGLLPWTLSNAAGRAASVTLLSLVEAVFCSVSTGSTLQLSCSTSVKSISLRDITTC